MIRTFLTGAALAAATALTSTAWAQEKLNVAIVSGISDITQFDGQFAAGVRDTLEAYDGAEVTVEAYAPSGGMEDELGMDAILRDMVTIAPDYLLFIVVHWETVQDRLVALQEAGVNLMVVEFAPEDAGDVKPFAWAITDHTESGRVTGASAAEHYCRDFAGATVKAALFHGTASSEIGINRMNGIQEAFSAGLAECDKTVEYVNEVFANFNRERAFELAQQVATANPDVNIIFGANSNTALGIMEGLRTVGVLDKVDVTGIGGQLEELAGICRREILTAGVRNPRGQGQAAGKVVIAHHEGKPYDEISYAPQTTVNNCEEVFAFYPLQMLENPAFRDNLNEGQWQPVN
ncbi:MAG: substrate-binding domain-containing protein [Pirellulales bacterium]